MKSDKSGRVWGQDKKISKGWDERSFKLTDSNLQLTQENEI